MKVIAEEYLPNSTILMNEHGGKRSAICKGIEYLKEYNQTEYFILVDSDTVLDANASKYMVECIDQKNTIGCATGSLTIFNTHFLAKIINARYNYAFNIERSCMSYFGIMNCCSGPLSIYRTNLFDESFITEFKTQTFLGTICGPGDDRHLTNMVLIRGYESKQTSLAIGSTEAPLYFMRFLRQQVRWLRSFYREQCWQIQAIPNQHPFLGIVTQYEILYPFFILSWIIYMFINDNPYRYLRFYIMSFLIMLIRTGILVIKMKDSKYVYNIFYLPIFLFFIIPLKVYCCLTMYKMHWITSTRNKLYFQCDLETFSIYSILIAWNSLLLYTLIMKIINFSQHGNYLELFYLH